MGEILTVMDAGVIARLFFIVMRLNQSGDWDGIRSPRSSPEQRCGIPPADWQHRMEGNGGTFQELIKLQCSPDPPRHNLLSGSQCRSFVPASCKLLASRPAKSMSMSATFPVTGHNNRQMNTGAEKFIALLT